MSDIAPAAAPSSPSASAPAAEAAPIVAPVPNPAEAAAPTEAEALASFDITKFTDSQVAELESGDPERIAKALGGTVKPAEIKPAEGVKTNPEQFSSHANPGERLRAAIEAKTPEQLESAGVELRRVSLASLPAKDRALTVQALDMIRAGKSSAAAFAEVFGIQSVAASPAPAPSAPELTEPAPTPQVHPKVAAMESELAAMESEYEDAMAAYDPKAPALLRKAMRKEMDLRDARREAAIEAQQQAAQAEYATTWEAEQAESQARSMDKFSDLITDPDANGDEGFLTRCKYEIFLAEQRNDSILTQADWSEKIGQKVYDKFFKGKAANSADLEQGESPSIPPAPKQKVRLPGSPAGIGTAAGGLSLEAADAEFNKLSWEDRLDALGKIEAATKQRK